MGSTHRDIRKCSEGVREIFGFALYQAQLGARHVSATAMKGFGGASVLEAVEDDADGTHRCVYTVKFPRLLYIIHVFPKKSRNGIKTPRVERRP